MSVVRCAVIGVGHLGKFHAQKYSTLKNCKLVALADPNPENALALSKQLNCKYVADYKQILNEVDAVSIVVPTSLHYAVASVVLDAGVNILLEKPITNSVKEANILNTIAQENDLSFQIGHIERFNPALLKLQDILKKEHKDPLKTFTPNFIEAIRISPFNSRATDVDVIIDLMIHDIDLVLNMVNSPISSVSARGLKVLSTTIDIGNARLEFKNGCVANITSSRVSEKIERKMKIFTKEAYYSVDFHNQKLKSTVIQSKTPKSNEKMKISTQTFEIDPSDALETEIKQFILSCKSSSPVAVSANDGIKALETAIFIKQKIHESVN